VAHRFYTSHAGQHYDETLHAYALDTETQHVWDFAGQGYVHRLLQNKQDGKLVEVNDPNNTTSQERSLNPGLSDAQEGEVVHRKLEGFASQYYTLLKSQLEQQRIFYEGRLQEIRREFAIKQTTANNDKADLNVVLRQERKQLAHRLVSLKRRHEKVTDDVTFLKSMNESLEANKAPLERKIKQAQQERSESREMIQKYLPALEEKVTLLMLQLEESMNTIPPSSSSPSPMEECAPPDRQKAESKRS
jgi:BRCA1-associated protein